MKLKKLNGSPQMILKTTQSKLILPRKEAIAYSLITDWIKKN